MGDKEEGFIKKYSLVLTNRAQQDLLQISNYIGTIKQEPYNAIKVIGEINKTLEQVILNPVGYKECPELKTKSISFRQAICYHWLILFKIENNLIRILTIVSGRRLRSRIKDLRDLV
jgi:plasmid stabilization system protein ParE